MDLRDVLKKAAAERDSQLSSAQIIMPDISIRGPTPPPAQESGKKSVAIGAKVGGKYLMVPTPPEDTN